MQNKITFSVNDAKLIDENPDSSFAVLVLDFFASGMNLHDLYVSIETLQKTATTIFNRPLVWKYDKKLDDAYTHDAEEVPCGFIPKGERITQKTLEDGRVMLSVKALLWKRYSGVLMDILKRDRGKKPVSVEMIVKEAVRRDDGIVELTDFSYEGVTILGTFVRPAIPGANVTVVSFSELESEFNRVVEEEYPEEVIAFSDEKNEKEIDMTKKLTQEELAQLSQVSFETKADESPEKSQKEDFEGKDAKEEEMSEDASPEDEKGKEEMSDEVPAEEQEEKMSEDSDKEDSDKEDSDKEDSKEEEMSEDKGDEEKEEEKDKEAYFAQVIAELTAEKEALATELEALTAERDSLKEFQANVYAKEKDFIVHSTIVDLGAKVVLPEDVRVEMLEEADKYDFANINEWVTVCKAKAYEFSVRENDKEDKNENVVRIGTFWNVSSKRPSKKSIWS